MIQVRSDALEGWMRWIGMHRIDVQRTRDALDQVGIQRITAIQCIFNYWIIDDPGEIRCTGSMDALDLGCTGLTSSASRDALDRGIQLIGAILGIFVTKICQLIIE